MSRCRKGHLLPVAASLCPQRLDEQSLDVTDRVSRVGQELFRRSAERIYAGAIDVLKDASEPEP